MKANRKFLGGNNDEAVSPVIAVILMVAITVVLAATVYVWVSGFGAQSGEAAKTISLTSDGPISASSIKAYTVASSTPGLKWGDISFTINGAAKALDANAGCQDPPAANVTVCSATTTEDADDTVNAGDTVKLYVSSGDTLRILDTDANSVILTLTVG